MQRTIRLRIEKLANIGFATSPAQTVPAPVINELALSLECEVVYYSKTDWPWSLFDPQVKREWHETVFPGEMKKAFGMGRALVG